jgi:exodeoxyribonuclease VII large subunit
VEALSRRLGRCGQRSLEEAGQRHDFAAGRLKAALEKNAAAHDRDFVRIAGRFVPALLTQPSARKAERLAGASERLASGLGRNVAAHGRDLQRIASRLRPEVLTARQTAQAERLTQVADKLGAAMTRRTERAAQGARLGDLQARMKDGLSRRLQRAGDRLETLEKLRLSLNPDRPLELGFARVHRASGELVRSGAELASGEAVRLKFRNDERGAVIDGTPALATVTTTPSPAPAAKPKVKAAAAAPAPAVQGDLF